MVCIAPIGMMGAIAIFVTQKPARIFKRMGLVSWIKRMSQADLNAYITRIVQLMEEPIKAVGMSYEEFKHKCFNPADGLHVDLRTGFKRNYAPTYVVEKLKEDLFEFYIKPQLGKKQP